MFSLRLPGLIWCVGFTINGFSASKDLPFKQDAAVPYSLSPELRAARFDKALIDRNGILYVLSDLGVARAFGTTLALDKSFRPLTGKKPLDIALHRGQIYYLYPDELISNGAAGKFRVGLAPGKFERIAFTEDGTGLLAGRSDIALVKNSQLSALGAPATNVITRIVSAQNDLFVIDTDTIHRLIGGRLTAFHRAPNLSAIAFRGREMIVGTTNGYYSINLDTSR